ncbi:hypothetical protein AMTRI_Chr10g229260 [Amborella trichopoda]
MRFSPFLNCFTRRFRHNSIRMCLLQSDNSKEYHSIEFQNYFAEHGILHQTSCAHTQQNGVAERKNQHLLEVTHSLLINMRVPKVYWGDALLTACYLINSMFSSILNKKASHSVLFLDAPLFVVPPRVFECSYFVHRYW